MATNLAESVVLCYMVRYGGMWSQLLLYKDDRLSTEDPVIRSLYIFQVYYQTRRILFEMSITLPQDKSLNAFNNAYNRSAYKRICREIQIDKNVEWRQKKDFIYFIRDGY